MKLKGIYGEQPLEEEKEFFLRLVKVNDYLELQAVDASGKIIDAGHLIRFEEHGDTLKAYAYTSVNESLPFELLHDGRIDVKPFH